ncbi:GspE/PulE family protein [Metaclostridioides mangenotii]|uniref:GspE/PulE family protein n=1 Tax=Metaclostridioides mangenotii TaxID=1540 RepID=UPI00068ABFE8|nr:GspE/PulE family protein [Clostridioides mangenotii]
MSKIENSVAPQLLLNDEGNYLNSVSDASDLNSYININADDNNVIKRLFYDLLTTAVELNASDIHIEPFEGKTVVRMRVDGEIIKRSGVEIGDHSALSTIIKLSAGMDITERRLPQDGRADIRVKSKVIDIRVSTMPTIFGEKIVLRILNRDSFLKSKKELGFSKKSIDLIEGMIGKKSGLILVTGPTGSGKTTTVYTLLDDLRDTSKNIMTIENPVEYKMDGINQIQINPKIGLNFENGLRGILRQDPDVIMVGEIRDLETAKIAIRAAITGHLVISTLHTNDAVSAITRLLEMGIEPYLLSASIIGVLSQKLVRKVCGDCSHEISIKDNLYEEIKTKVAVGCKKCNDIGYLGRTAIYEVLNVDDDIKTFIKESPDINYIKNIAISSGMITFNDCCRRLIEKKITTLEECISVEEIV